MPPKLEGTNLGHIPALLRNAQEMAPGFIGLQYMCKFPTGQFFFQSKLDLDTDGKEDPGIKYEPTHQKQTSIDSGGKVVSSNITPYFVLPGSWGKDNGIKLGDVAAVIYKDKIEFAVFADTGPAKKIGEGSIALHRALGFERVRQDGRIIDAGIPANVITIIFPGSGNGTPQTPEAIRAIGRKLFDALCSVGVVANPPIKPSLTADDLAGLRILTKLLRPGAKLPIYGTPRAAGMDFFWCPNPADPTEVLRAGRSRRVFRLGVAMAIPEGYYIELKARSGLALKCGISVLAGVIDDDFRGEILAVLETDEQGWALANLQPGDRVVQGILKKKISAFPAEVDELPPTERGERGCGSTGR